MIPTGEFCDSDEEENYPEQNVEATYAQAKFARIRPIAQGQPEAVQVEIEPKSIVVTAGQLITSSHQRLIDLAIDSTGIVG